MLGKLIWCEIVLEDIVLTQHILNALLAFLDLYFLLMNLRRFGYFLIDDKWMRWKRIFLIVFLWLFWHRIFLLLLKTAVLRVAHISIRGRFRIRPYNNSFWLWLLVLFNVRCLNGQVSAFLTFTLVLFACRINLSNDIFIHLDVIFSFVTWFVLILI